MQCRSLGARIISLLNSSLDPENDAPDGSSHANQETAQPNGLDPTTKRKRKIIIHTSPFLRCLQTAIAVSSGISQNNQATSGQPHNGPNQLTDKCLLRVDACLGEWLTPDYYEEITPPPSSGRMIVAAKAELLRRGEDILSNIDSGSRSATGYFPGGWGSASTPVSPEVGKPQQPAITSIQMNRNRSGSYDTVTNPRAKGVLTKINTNLSHLPPAGYVPPTPGYAISPSDPIPSGYVAHARDSCVRVDYPWDSTRNPNWGDGGDYGEEWSSMHGRFRRSLRNMIDWYGDDPLKSNGASEEDEATDTVLVIITHGAGCNALIGALTGEPVLIDVGTSSLTMATPRDGETDARSPVSDSSDDLLQKYSLKLVASTDHLRPGVNPSDISSLASPKAPSVPSIPSYRQRVPSRQSLSPSPFIIGPSITSSSGTSDWAMSRPSTAPRISSGLWGQDGGTDSGDEIVPNFDGPSTPQTNGGHTPVEGSSRKDIPQRTMSQRGLWGSAPLNKDREAAVKRRWTVTERRG